MTGNCIGIRSVRMVPPHVFSAAQEDESVHVATFVCCLLCTAPSFVLFYRQEVQVISSSIHMNGNLNSYRVMHLDEKKKFKGTCTEIETLAAITAHCFLKMLVALVVMLLQIHQYMSCWPRTIKQIKRSNVQ